MDSSPSVPTGPPLSLLVREKARAYLAPFPYDVGSEGNSDSSLPESREDAVYTNDGSLFVTIEGVEQQITVRDGATGSVVCQFGGEGDSVLPLKFNFATFSPRGTFVLAWARPVTGSSVPNLVVCDAKSGKMVSSFFQKTFHLDHWPSLQWSDDESVAARFVSNTIHFFDGTELGSGPKSKLHVQGVSGFALSKGPAPYHVAVFVSGKSGAPGRISLHQHPENGGAELLQRSTFRADAVEFKWSPTGAACLALASTESDSSGKSYYGESEAYFLKVAASADSSTDASVKPLQLPQEGPTYDVGWSPSGNKFVVIYGFMPARATLFDDRCEPVFDFGTGPRNTVAFSPHGRFLALAGFGSLAGAVQIWDVNKNCLVGNAHLPASTTHCWSPCSRYFLAATTFPRLRVDNLLRVIRFDGKLVHEHKMPDTLLLQARFRPALKSSYLDPKLSAQHMIGGPLTSPGVVDSDTTKSSNMTSKKPGGVYRPPGARGTAASFSLHRDISAGKVDKASFMSTSGNSGLDAVRRPGSVQRSIPGLDTAAEEKDAAPSKAALKRKKKKEKERLAAEGATGPGGDSAAPNDASAAPVPIEELDSVEAVSKRIKGLKKKLRQIEGIKSSKAEGKQINVDQEAKLATEDSLSEQLAVAEKKLATL